LIPRPANPDPAGPNGIWLPYIVTTNAVVNIRVYDVAGEVVRDLKPYQALTGANEEFWDERNNAGNNCASGVFIYRIQATAGEESQEAWLKLAIVR
jgi:flagellar hook assembly protein FlgD